MKRKYKRRNKKAKRRAGTFILPAKKVYQYKSPENYLRQVYRLNEEKFLPDKETGEILSQKKFINNVLSRRERGVNTDRAIREFSRMDDFTEGGDTIAKENIIKNLKGKKELQKKFKEALSHKGSYREIDMTKIYYDDTTGLYLIKDNPSQAIRFKHYSNANPYKQGDDIFEIIDL